MRYLMKEKLIALGQDFVIQDESGRDAYFVDGKALSFGDKLVFKDMAGTERARIEPASAGGAPDAKRVEPTSPASWLTLLYTQRAR